MRRDIKREKWERAKILHKEGRVAEKRLGAMALSRALPGGRSRWEDGKAFSVFDLGFWNSGTFHSTHNQASIEGLELIKKIMNIRV